MVKLFLKKPGSNQGLVQKVLQLATAESDNPDIRDRAYVYWRLLSGDLDVAKVSYAAIYKRTKGGLANTSQNIILSQKPAISTTMTSLPNALLEQLLTELSTLASVYHKPPESFVGKGRFGADEIQAAALQEQRQNAAENPIAAAAVAAAANGASAQNNLENLLDIDFDGAAPASADTGTGTPDRMASPASTGGLGGPPASGSSIADMMGLFDAPPAPPAGAPSVTSGGMGDLMNGFAEMDISGSSHPPPAGQQLGHAPPQQKSTSAGDDLLGLF